MPVLTTCLFPAIEMSGVCLLLVCTANCFYTAMFLLVCVLPDYFQQYMLKYTKNFSWIWPAKMRCVLHARVSYMPSNTVISTKVLWYSECIWSRLQKHPLPHAKFYSLSIANSRSFDRGLGNQNPGKKRRFLWRKFIHSLITWKQLNVESWNLCTTWVQMKALCVLILEFSEWKKVGKFEPIYLGKPIWTKNGLQFLSIPSTTLISFGYVHLPQFENYFSFCFFFFFLFNLSAFKPLNAQYLNFERL